MDNSLLVKDRECGECTICCIELTIEDPELVKLPGVKCKHLSSTGGCAIYQTRPQTCQNWFCMWRFLPLLDDQWRPDNKGILIRQTFDDIPKAYANKIALEFSVIGNRDIIFDIDFIELLGGYILQGFPCFLSIGKPKQSTGKSFLNDQLYFAFEQKNLTLIKEKLSDALKSAIKIHKDKMRIRAGKIITTLAKK